MSIQAVFFDMGGTIETYGYTRQFRIKATPGLKKILSSAGIELNLSNEQLYEVVSDGLNRYHDWSLVNLEEYPAFIVWRDYVFKDFDIDIKALERISEDLMCYIETDYFYRDIRPEVPSVLGTIKDMGYKIGMISNVNSRGQVPTNLKKYGIIDYFDPIILSSEYGRRKPDPAIFHYAARMADVPTSKCLFVGDRVIRDVIGAKKAGYGLVVQIKHDYDHGEDDSGPAPDAVIDNMNQLVDILKKDAASVTNNVVQDQQIKALLFDAGDILYFRPDKGRYFREFLAENSLEGKNVSEEKLLDLKRKAFTGVLTQDQKRKLILKEFGISDTLLMEKGCLALEQDDNFIDFFEGVPTTLTSLKKMGYLLGIITDTANPLYVKLQWFEKGGFGHVWDSIISSQEMGMQKPDPRLYAASLKQLGIGVDQAVFVGHCQAELEGARAIGLKTIGFNLDPGAWADITISHFNELLNLSLIQNPG